MAKKATPKKTGKKAVRPKKKAATSAAKRSGAKRKPTASKSAKRPANATSARKTKKTSATKVAKRKTATKVAKRKTTTKAKKARTPRVAATTRKASTTRKAATKAKKVATRRAATDKRPARSKRSAAGLTARDLDQFRRLLLEKRAQLMGDVSTLQREALGQGGANAAGVSSSMPIHMADLGTDNYEKEFTLGLIEGERNLLREIDAALARLRDGTYGICQATGKPIGKARLRAKPWAKYCYEYVLEMERRGKRV